MLTVWIPPVVRAIVPPLALNVGVFAFVMLPVHVQTPLVAVRFAVLLNVTAVVVIVALEPTKIPVDVQPKVVLTNAPP